VGWVEWGEFLLIFKMSPLGQASAEKEKTRSPSFRRAF
jgi:hypothetical protein